MIIVSEFYVLKNHKTFIGIVPTEYHLTNFDHSAANKTIHLPEK